MAEAAVALEEARSVAAGGGRGQFRTVVASIPLADIRPNPGQPRRYFEPAAMADLAASIRTRGLLHPIIVARDGGGFMILAGERRYRAARLAGLEQVPALIRDDDPLELALIENLQREDLTPLEEADALGQLAERCGYTHDQLARLIGKSRPYVSNTLTLRRLPDPIKTECRQQPQVSREILIALARAESGEKRDMLWRLAKLRKVSVKRFRAEQAGEPAGQREIAELSRHLRRLGRTLRTIDVRALSGEQRHRMNRVLRRAQVQVVKALGQLAAVRD